jgi:hypothetical protein
MARQAVRNCKTWRFDVKRLFLTFAAAVLMTPSVCSAETLWGTNASACVPSSTTTAKKFHKSGTLSVGFASGKTGKIELICHIARQVSTTATWGLQMNYTDSTGPGAKASVKSELFRVPIAGGAPVLVTAVDSNSFPATATTAFSPLLSHTFNFDTGAYFVKVTLKRAGTGQNVKIHSLFLIEG